MRPLVVPHPLLPPLVAVIRKKVRCRRCRVKGPASPSAVDLAEYLLRTLTPRARVCNFVSRCVNNSVAIGTRCRVTVASGRGINRGLAFGTRCRVAVAKCDFISTTVVLHRIAGLRAPLRSNDGA